MSIIDKIIGWVKEVVTDIRDDTNPSDRAKDARVADKALGKKRVSAAAKGRGIEVDPDSIHDVLELLRVVVGEGFSGEKQFRRKMAHELGIVKKPEEYTGTPKQNVDLLNEVYVMVGQGGITNPDRPAA